MVTRDISFAPGIRLVIVTLQPEGNIQMYA